MLPLIAFWNFKWWLWCHIQSGIILVSFLKWRPSVFSIFLLYSRYGGLCIFYERFPYLWKHISDINLGCCYAWSRKGISYNQAIFMADISITKWSLTHTGKVRYTRQFRLWEKSICFLCSLSFAHMLKKWQNLVFRSHEIYFPACMICFFLKCTILSSQIDKLGTSNTYISSFFLHILELV